jgi:RNA polymerase-binding protein DksA
VAKKHPRKPGARPIASLATGRAAKSAAPAASKKGRAPSIIKRAEKAPGKTVKPTEKSTDKTIVKITAAPADKAAPKTAARARKNNVARKHVARAPGAGAAAAASAAAAARDGAVKVVRLVARPGAVPPAKPARDKAARREERAAAAAAASAAAPQPPLVIPRPVPTDGKPRKNQAGLSTRELEHYRELLLQKRRELVGDMSSMEREALRSTQGSNLSNLPLHMADMGTDNYEQEFTLGLVEKDRQLLREINRALAKIMDGSYGICEGTGKPINKPRLEAQPWAKYSIEYARQLERGMIRR